MNQDDFRQMLAGRDARGGSGNDQHARYGGKRNLSELDLAEVKKLSAKKPKKKSKRPKRAEHGDEAEPGDDAERLPKSAYRDRAAERRQGVGGDMIDADEFAHLDTEQSKFLGGDMEHTHLVKGLDFALLAQLKREKEKLARATSVKKRKSSAEPPLESKPLGQRLAFTSRMGRLVYFHACQSATLASGHAGALGSTRSELFLPGRMFYTFNLDVEELESTPVSVQRSKEDCPEPDELVNGMVDEALVNRVSELLSSAKSGKKMRRKKAGVQPHHSRSAGAADVAEEGVEPALKAQNSTVEALEDEDEDIFPDVGDYVPMDQRVEDETVSTAKQASIKETGYFTNLSAAISAKEEAARKQEVEAEQAWKATLQKAAEKQRRAEREEERQAKQAKLASQMDDYAEYQAEGALDSDDEDDEETVRRRKAAGLSDRNAADPEAAQTEKLRRKKQKQGSKLSSDLNKINKLIEAKEVEKK